MHYAKEGVFAEVVEGGHIKSVRKLPVFYLKQTDRIQQQ